MLRAAVFSERFFGAFGYVRAAHYDRDASGTDGIRNLVGASHHAGHCPDSDETNVLVFAEFNQLFTRHCLRVAVDQYDLVAVGGERLEKEHPQMRHEVTRDPVIRIVKQNFHNVRPFFERAMGVNFDVDDKRGAPLKE
jgi:hypothetical protein